MRTFTANCYRGQGQLSAEIDAASKVVKVVFHDSQSECDYAFPELNEETVAAFIEHLKYGCAESDFSLHESTTTKISAESLPSEDYTIMLFTPYPPSGFDTMESVTLSKRVRPLFAEHLERLLEVAATAEADKPVFGCQ